LAAKGRWTHLLVHYYNTMKKFESMYVVYFEHLYYFLSEVQSSTMHRSIDTVLGQLQKKALP
jgi:hypothetical protein